ncbi:hypothetical protein, partial [Streptomyces sp. ICBB 8177]|uniref:hypothetical protein n=1 Tax=Streptomyces sp. ICBB 8177 TaxID=563922 RepID=UPI000D676BB3
RLPEGDAGTAARRPARSSSRTLVTVTGVVVLLIAALAFATRGASGGSTDDAAKNPTATPTAPTGTHPATTQTSGIPTGYPHTEEGAQSAAANFAVALGSDGMFNTSRRHEIVAAIADPSALTTLQSGFDSDYSAAFLSQVGLSKSGTAPQGQTFVDRTIPAGAKLTSLQGNQAEVSVWCTGLFGLAGVSSTKPVTSSWFTVTFTLNWSGSDWKVLRTSQSKGPTPVSGDDVVSGANQIAGAVQGYGGFTYAR